MDNSDVIYAKDLVKSYEWIEALHGVNREVQSGEIFGFLGSNGARKTTTNRCRFDLIRSDGGIFRVFGLNSHDNPSKSECSCASDGRIE